MLNMLHRALHELPDLLDDEAGWDSLYVDYHHPYVERLYRPFEDGRVYLHKIHPCERGEALLHPHPWPSAMLVVNRVYEMGVGFGKEQPPIASTLTLHAGCAYEMTHPDSWHYVHPIEVAAYSIMVTGKPWDRETPKSSYPLQPLDTQTKSDMLSYFRAKLQMMDLNIIAYSFLEVLIE